MARSQRRLVVLVVACLCCLLPKSAFAAGLFASSQPEQGGAVTGRRPKITVSFTAPVDASSVAATLDGTDVTPVSLVTAQSVTYTPVMTLTPGPHTFAVTARDATGAVLSGTLSFASRHSGLFEEVEGLPELGMSYEYAVKKPENLLNAPDAKFEANFSMDTKAREGALTIGAAAHLAYLQSQPRTEVTQGSEPYPPEGEVNVMDHLFSAAYEKGGRGLSAEVGTFQVDLTERTLSRLSRRGTRVGVKAGFFDASAFMIQGESSIDLSDPAGIGSTDDHLYGIAAGASIFEGVVKVKGIFVSGGETGSSAGVAGGEPQQGRTVGAVLSADLFERRLTAEVEADFSTVEPDGTSGSEESKDSAWSALVAGTVGSVDYKAGYELRGPDFNPIGNEQLEPDLEIAKAGLGVTRSNWRIALNVTNTKDNVDDDPARPVINSLQGILEASYTGFSKAPFGLSWQLGQQETSRDVDGIPPVDTGNATLSGWTNLTWGVLTLGLQATNSRQEDRSETGVGTTTTTVAATPSFAFGWLAVVPSYWYARVAYGGEAAATRTQVLSLDVRSSFLQQRLTGDLAGTWTANEADDASVDTTSVDANARIAYAFGPLSFWPAKGSVAVKAVYSVSEDHLAAEKSDDLGVSLALTLAIPLFF